MMRLLFIAAAVVVAALVVIRTDTLFTSGAPVSFVETFDGVPGSPQPFDSPHWDVQVHERQQVINPVGYTAGESAVAFPLSGTTTVTVDCTDEVWTASGGSIAWWLA